MPYDPNDPNQDSQAPDLTPQTLAQQAASLTNLIATGQITPSQAQTRLPSNTKLVNGIVVPNDPSMLPLFIMAAAIAAPFAVQGLTALASGGAGATGAATASGAEAAPETTLLGSTPGAALPSAAGTATLPSSTIGSGAITGAPSSVASGAMDTASSAGLTDWLKTAGDIGSALGAAGSGAAAGRNADNNANIGFAQAQNNLYNSELRAPGQIAQNSVRGDILSNARDVSMAAPSDIPVPQISGGLRPSMFSDTTRQLGQNITANAAATQMPVATPPTLQPFETAGTGSNILNTAGVIGSLAKTIPPSVYGQIAGLFS